MKITWLDRPQDHDYVAAMSYLLLTNDRGAAKAVVRKLKQAKMIEFAAKDIFRASGLPFLGVSDSHVERDTAVIAGGSALSPILLCRDAPNAKVIVADGYHRLCAVYGFDEDAMIPCKIV